MHALIMTNRVWLFLGLLLTLSACAQVQANVETYSALPAKSVPKTFSIAAFEEDDSNSLQWKAFAEKVEAKLIANGYQKSTSANPDLLVFFGYAIDQGQTVTSSYSIPQYGQTGVSSSYTTGTVSSSGYVSARTTYQPRYGITGYTTGTTISTVYSRSMAINIVDVKSKSRVWETKLSSKGSCGVIVEVIDELLEIAFTDFPNPQSGRKRVKGKFDC